MQNKPFVSIINPIRNTERTLEKCLESLVALDYPKESLEFIFADGGSRDATVPIIRRWQEKYPQIKLVEVADCKSPGQARNAALAVAKGEYILFTDGDCYVRRDWVNKILEPFFKDPKVGMVGGEIHTMRTDNNDTEIYCEQTKFLSVSGRCRLSSEGYYPAIEKDLPHEVNGNIDSPFFATANAAVSKAAADAIGREFWHEITNEDVDFSIRILKQGYKLYYKPDAVVEHMHRMALKDYAKQLYGYGFGHPLPVRAHAKKVFEICLQYFGYIYIPIPFFVKGVLYIGDFHLMHIFGALFLLQLIAGVFNPALINGMFLLWGIIFAWFTFFYFKPVFKIKPAGKFLTWAKIRYLSNWALMRGGFKGMRTWKVFYIESSW
ncbi:MAG: glycosyltransferase [Candidatus Omnitrophota bacterium]|jgi:glycosyltransferase involved in cell wall biosynthesis